MDVLSDMLTPSSVIALLIRVRNGTPEVCRVTRRNEPEDFGLIGGKIDPQDKNPLDALIREVREEAGINVLQAELVFERVDPVDGKVAWCYHVTKWEGEPHQCEPGIEISWGKPETLLTDNCTFRHYNTSLFTHLGMIK